ncbi:hypothetical protein ACI2KT_29625 [Ensifer adhaerens]|uniref:hypothetical protein n=1 Tax=Ensifer adhaerens TaxID=106592 RepID=UPI003850B9A8
MGASFACPTRALAALRVQLFLILLDLLGLEVAFDQQLIFREDLGVDLGPLLGVVAMPGALQFGGDGVMPPPSRPKVQVVLEAPIAASTFCVKASMSPCACASRRSRKAISS